MQVAYKFEMFSDEEDRIIVSAHAAHLIHAIEMNVTTLTQISNLHRDNVVSANRAASRWAALEFQQHVSSMQIPVYQVVVVQVRTPTCLVNKHVPQYVGNDNYNN